MVVPRLLRLEELLGCRVEQANESALQRLIEGRIREDTDLESKRELYGTTDAAKRDLATDLSAMANSRGGVIVLGMDENTREVLRLFPQSS